MAVTKCRRKLSNTALFCSSATFTGRSWTNCGSRRGGIRAPLLTLRICCILLFGLVYDAPKPQLPEDPMPAKPENTINRRSFLNRTASMVAGTALGATAASYGRIVGLEIELTAHRCLC